MAIAITEAGSAGRTVAALLDGAARAASQAGAGRADDLCQRNAMCVPVARYTGASHRERTTERAEYGHSLSPAGHAYQDVHEMYAGGGFNG